MQDNNYLDLFTNRSNQLIADEHIRKHKQNDYCLCCYQNNWGNFVNSLIWPVFLLIIIFIFKERILEILKEIPDLIKRIHSVKYRDFEIVARNKEALVDELFNDIKISKKDIDDSETELVSNIVKKDYSNYFSKKTMNKVNEIAQLRIKMKKFEKTALDLLEHELKQKLYRDKTIKAYNHHINIDGYFTFEKDFFMIEVKLVKKVTAALISNLLQRLDFIQRYTPLISCHVGEEIFGKHLILIFPEDTIILNEAQRLIRDNEIWVYKVNEQRDELIKVGFD